MKCLLFAAGLVAGVALTQTEPKSVPANPELAKMYSEDQGDRMPSKGKEIDWKIVGPRDAARRKRLFEIYREGAIVTGEDYANAAMVLQHGTGDDQLLAHEFCVASLAQGNRDAAWLAAASEDRWLNHIGRKQRFGTQYMANQPDMIFHLQPVEEGVSDGLRKALHVPSLAEAKKREAEMNKKG